MSVSTDLAETATMDKTQEQEVVPSPSYDFCKSKNPTVEQEQFIDEDDSVSSLRPPESSESPFPFLPWMDKSRQSRLLLVVLLVVAVAVIATSIALGVNARGANASNLSTDAESDDLTELFPSEAPVKTPTDNIFGDREDPRDVDMPSITPIFDFAPAFGFERLTPTPSKMPTNTPSNLPSNLPSEHPSSLPSGSPSDQPTDQPSKKPTFSFTYLPGKLNTLKEGILLSEGLDVKLIATKYQRVLYRDGGQSDETFHSQPDAGATFVDPRSNNVGGHVYVSNSEVTRESGTGGGGVGAITFDASGMPIDYRMVLKDSTHNCGGGRSPWHSWISCEEVEGRGVIYQVDPLGQREPQVITLGNDGGRWESFAYDIRNPESPRFFVTEDHHRGTLRRFTPDSADWNNAWEMLHGPGKTDFLMLFPNSENNGGTFVWTDDLGAAKENALRIYPQTEGVDVLGSELAFVCKGIRQIFTLDLDAGTYFNHTTVSGLFDGHPDQINRMLGSSNSMLYFTEEGGKDAGIHARDREGRLYTILESPEYTDETTGLAFSPDGKFLYLAYQDNGLLFQVWRKDGHPFSAERIDVKYHNA